MKDVLLFGISELSERIAYYIDCGESVRPFRVKGFVIDDAYFTADAFAGKRVYRYSEAPQAAVIVCIGYKNMNENRREIFYRLRDDGRDIESFISTHAVIHTDALGTGNIFLGKSLIEFKSSMGDGNIFDSGHVGHHSRLGSFNFFSCNVSGGNVTVGDCCFVGLNATLRNSITLHDKTFVGAGCYLNRSTDKPGMCYAAPKAVCLGDSERVMKTFAVLKQSSATPPPLITEIEQSSCAAWDRGC